MQQARLSAMRRIACSIEDAADCVTVVVTALLIIVRVVTVTSIDAASKLSKSLDALHLDGGWLAASDVSGTDGRISLLAAIRARRTPMWRVFASRGRG